MTPKLKTPRLELEDNILLKILKKYKANPCLWDTTHRNYHNKPVKSAAWDQLLELWRKCEPRATQHDVKVKIFHMRTNYTRQRKKVESSAASAIPYKPTLWYYKHMNFLSGKEKSDNEDDDDSDSDNNDETEHIQPLRGNRKISLTTMTLEKEPESIEAPAAAFGRSVGAQLQQMSKMQRCVAEKLISDVIYHAKMEQLTMDAFINIKGTQDDINVEVNPVIPKSGPSWYDTPIETDEGQESLSSTFITNPTNEDLVQREIDETESAVNFIKFETNDNQNFVFQDDYDQQSNAVEIDIKQELL